VVSTTGAGEPPDNMRSLWSFLLRKSLPASALQNTEFAVFGLGDSAYAGFNVVSKRLDRRLEQLGAKRLLQLGLADDQHPLGGDAMVGPWMELLWQQLVPRNPRATLPIPNMTILPPRFEVTQVSAPDAVAQLQLDDSCPCHAQQAPYATHATVARATVTQNTRITAADWDQDVRNLQFQLPEGADVVYEPGDVCQLQPRNPPEVVTQFLAILQIEPQTVLEIKPASGYSGALPLPSPVTAGELASKCLDLCGMPNRGFFEVLSRFSADESEQERLDYFGSEEASQNDDFQVYCTRERRTYVEVLSDFKTARPSLAHLLDCIPILQTRSFSIASAQQALPRGLELCVALVKYRTKFGRTKQGTCSLYIDQLQPGSQVDLWIKNNSLMRLSPACASAPIIMVGPGTGVAPFRAMVQARVAEAEAAEGESPLTLLFFGCRNREKDWLYGEEMQEYEQRGVLAAVEPAFSRDQQEKIYVQHRIKQHSQLVCQVLQDPSAHVFVAGSAGEMPKAVRAAFATALEECSGLSADESEAALRLIEKQRRYHVECWS